MADPGQGPAVPPLLSLDETEPREVEKKILRPPPLSQGLNDPPPPPYLKVWIRH